MPTDLRKLSMSIGETPVNRHIENITPCTLVLESNLRIHLYHKHYDLLAIQLNRMYIQMKQWNKIAFVAKFNSNSNRNFLIIFLEIKKKNFFFTKNSISHTNCAPEHFWRRQKRKQRITFLFFKIMTQYAAKNSHKVTWTGDTSVRNGFPKSELTISFVWKRELVSSHTQ